MSQTIRITSYDLLIVLLLNVLLLFTTGYTEQQDSYPKLKSVQIVSEHSLSSRMFLEEFLVIISGADNSIQF